jgi:hypothetical protein
MERKLFTFAMLLVGMMSILLFSSFDDRGAAVASEAANDSATVQPAGFQRITAFDLDAPFTFAGEQVPTENFDAIERFDRELLVNTYQHSATLLNIKQAYRYFPVIEPILAQYGIPDDFKYLCVAESNLRMATSPSGAKGLWQFMEPAAKAYGLEISEDVDERYHVEKSTDAACRFLLRLKERFGSWTLAAAAYNMGETALAKRIAQQRVDTYYDLHLPEETSRYVFRIYAIKEIMTHPERYGFHVAESQRYAPMEAFNAVEVNGPVPDLAAFALSHGTTYRHLKLYNPWLLGNVLTNKTGKTYTLRVPTS